MAVTAALTRLAVTESRLASGNTCSVHVQLLRMEGGADAVAQAVAVAVAARDAELAGLQRHAAELEGHLESVMHEAQEVQQESLDMRDHVVQLEAALRESEAKKCGLTMPPCSSVFIGLLAPCT